MKKMRSMIFLTIFLAGTFFTYFGNVNASYLASITGDEVNMREKPSTSNSSVLTKLYKDYSVEVLDDNFKTGSGCSAGWVNIKYNNIVGYVCANYIYIPGKDIYGRPWTSPKKAIIGGAAFIGNSYINAGQFTSYLKKFNVTGNSLFTHQYMGNLRAPYSEAKTSFNAYKNVGILDSQLVFSIPIYNNMADSYALPGTGFDSTGTDQVQDYDFEAKLDEQGFPESYKRRLRYVHSIHPNWIFEGIKTNLDFWYVVENEFDICVIDSTSSLYVNSVDYSTEKGWHTVNKDTAAYYLDPRNFIFNEERILQFEKLYFSDVYTESTVQAVLNNTFMSGVSVLDNQSYASIFVEAGRVNNVNPVYLASLSKQELGSNGSKASSGDEFTYDGKTYKGLYNFYNIGAYASASSPVLAGLVWGAVGYDYAGLNNQIPNSGVTNNSSDGSQNVTNVTPVLYTSSVKTGDLSGDGVINSADLLKMRQHLLGTHVLSGDFLKAADIDGNGVINSGDLLRMRQHLLGIRTIS